MSPVIHITKDQRYGLILDKHGVLNEEIDPWLFVGSPILKDKWLLYISVLGSHIVELLEDMLPLLASRQIPMRIINTQDNLLKLNGMVFGIQMVGKVITIAPDSTREATHIAEELLAITSKLKGPEIQNAARLSSTLYAFYNGENPPAEFPFAVHTAFRKPNNRRKSLIKYYIPYQMIRESPKAVIYRAINIKWLKFDWCLMKEGRPNMSEDAFGRGIADRLLWEKMIIQELSPYIPLPAVVDFFKRGESSYLITEFIEGITFEDRIIRFFKNIPKDGSTVSKEEIFNDYLQILSITEEFHRRGYIHRDITASNFIIRPDGKIYVVDLELTYPIDKLNSYPPFAGFTPGYKAPKQNDLHLPTPKDDIYSLGALLTFMISGIEPKILLNEDFDIVKDKLNALTDKPELTEVIIDCLSVEPQNRPTINEIRTALASWKGCLLYAVGQGNVPT